MEIFAKVNIQSHPQLKHILCKNVTLCVKHSTTAEIVTAPSILIAISPPACPSRFAIHVAAPVGGAYFGSTLGPIPKPINSRTS